MVKAYLKRDWQERFNLKRARFVNAWRLVDEEGRDLIQPWANTKTEAREMARFLGYQLIEEES
jgi:hypothetical protein